MTLKIPQSTVNVNKWHKRFPHHPSSLFQRRELTWARPTSSNPKEIPSFSFLPSKYWDFDKPYSSKGFLSSVILWQITELEGWAVRIESDFPISWERNSWPFPMRKEKRKKIRTQASYETYVFQIWELNCLTIDLKGYVMSGGSWQLEGGLLAYYGS